VRLQPGDVLLAQNGRITRLPCSALHPPGFVPPPVTRHRGGLLPHRFTLTPHHRSDAGRSVFCDTFRRFGVTPEPPPVARGGVSCGVRTFLPQPRFKSQERLPRFHPPPYPKSHRSQPGSGRPLLGTTFFLLWFNIKSPARPRPEKLGSSTWGLHQTRFTNFLLPRWLYRPPDPH